MILNCNAGGNCKKGYQSEVYKFLKLNGITEETCAGYEALIP